MSRQVDNTLCVQPPADNIVHLDLKYDNVMISQDCKVRIVDFGKARYIGSDPNRPCSCEILSHG